RLPPQQQRASYTRQETPERLPSGHSSGKILRQLVDVLAHLDRFSSPVQKRTAAYITRRDSEYAMPESACFLTGQLPDRLRADCDVRSDGPVLVDEVRDRRGEHAIGPRDLPVALQDDREGDAVLGRFPSIGVHLAAAHHQDLESLRASVNALEFRRDMVA